MQIKDRAEHEHGTGHRINEEFDRYFESVRAAPATDHEVHGHEGDFPKNVKGDQIKGRKNTDQTELKKHEHGKETFAALFDHFFGGPNSHGQKKRSEQNEPEADAVDAHVQTNVGAGAPRLVDLGSESFRMRERGTDEP